MMDALTRLVEATGKAVGTSWEEGHSPPPDLNHRRLRLHSYNTAFMDRQTTFGLQRFLRERGFESAPDAAGIFGDSTVLALNAFGDLCSHESSARYVRAKQVRRSNERSKCE
jgi:hypothetical protein